MKRHLLFIILVFINVPLFSRDIDLDRIYINPESTIYTRLTSTKEKIYTDISSLAVDTKTICAEWVSGEEIVYIKEYKELNIVFLYSRDKGKKAEITRFGGTVTSSAINYTKDTLIVKTLDYTDSGAAAFIYFINIRNGSVTRLDSPYFFLDYTLIPGSDSIILQGKEGLVRFSPAGIEKEVVFPAEKYRSLSRNGDPVLAFLSPDKTKQLFITGGGGSYKATLTTPASSSGISGITTSSDLWWIDNSMFVYCGGSAGEYSVNVYDSSTGKKAVLISDTLNPDINFSNDCGMLSCLENQMIVLFSSNDRKRFNTGIEGEEVFFSPDGRKFTSIYLGRLYITSINMLQKNRIAVRKNAEGLLSIYKSALDESGSWLNDYSKEYITKKIKLYEYFLRTME